MLLARIERLPPSAVLWKLILLLALGAFFEIYDLLMTGYVSPGLIQAGLFSEGADAAFGLSDQAAFAAVTFAGLWAGTLGLGWAADRFGRRTIFIWALLWYAAATALLSAQVSAGGIFLWRFVAGIGLGVEMVTINAYVAELANRGMRGRAFAFYQGVMFCSVPAVAFLSWALLPKAPLGIAGWRWVTFFPVLGAVAVWWIRRAIPESPRWLVQQQRLDEAERVIAALELRIEAELGRPLATVQPHESRPAEIPAGEPSANVGRLAELFQPPYRRWMLLLAIFNAFQAIGFYGFGNWVPRLVAGQGASVMQSLQYSALIALAYPAGPFLFMLIADRFERKWQTVASALGTASFGLLFTAAHAPLTIIGLGVAITLSNNLLSYSYHAYQSELFPTPLRARAVGFVYSFSRLSTIFTSFLIALLARQSGNPGVFAFIAASMVIAASAIALGPRTRGLALGEIARPGG